MSRPISRSRKAGNSARTEDGATKPSQPQQVSSNPDETDEATQVSAKNSVLTGRSTVSSDKCAATSGKGGVPAVPEWARDILAESIEGSIIGGDDKAVDLGDWGWVERLPENTLDRLRWMSASYEHLMIEGKTVPCHMSWKNWLALFTIAPTYPRFLEKMSYFHSVECASFARLEQRRHYDETNVNPTEGHQDKPPGIFLWHRKAAIQQWYRTRALAEREFAQPFIVDCRYNAYMDGLRREKLTSHLYRTNSVNQFLQNPFRLVYAGAPACEDSKLSSPGSLKPLLASAVEASPCADRDEGLTGWFPGDVDRARSNPVTHQWLRQGVFDSVTWDSAQTIRDAYPGHKLVYVTFDANAYMRKFDRDAIYIVAGVVNEGRNENRGLAYHRARSEGIETVQIPINLSSKWHTITKDRISPSVILSILATLRDTGSWELALDCLNVVLKQAAPSAADGATKEALQKRKWKFGQRRSKEDQFQAVVDW